MTFYFSTFIVQVLLSKMSFPRRIELKRPLRHPVMEEENYDFSGDSNEVNAEIDPVQEMATENSMPGAGEILSGLGSAVYHAGGVVYHAAQADVSWLTGDEAGFQQHLEESEDSLDAGAEGLRPLVESVGEIVGLHQEPIDAGEV
jgi:hypothetical protein